MPLAKACPLCHRTFDKGEKRNRAGGIITCFLCRPKLNGDQPAMVIKMGSSEKDVVASFPPIPKSAKDKTVEIMRILQQCGEGRVLAQIVYQKPGEDWVTERKIEPYHLTYAANGIIVRTWQTDPLLDEPSWRCFRVDRIASATATPISFRPRQPITLHTGEATKFVFGEEPEGQEEKAPPPIELYTIKLHEALADLELTETERRELAGVSKSLNLEQIRAAHGRFYAEALAEICADGRVTQDEIDRLTAIRVWLTELGWCP